MNPIRRTAAALAVLAMLVTACASEATVDSAGSATPSTGASPGVSTTADASAATTAATEAPPTSTSDSTASTAAPVTTATQSTEAPTTTVAPATTETTAAAPEPKLVNLVGGGQLDLNSIEGTDTVLWFWAPW